MQLTFEQAAGEQGRAEGMARAESLVDATWKAEALADEIWRPVCEGFYEVSDHGRVRRVKRPLHRGRGQVGRLLAIQTRRDGYHVVPIWIHGKVKNHMVHRLVAEAFIGLRPDGLFVNHKDGVKKNNRPSNLEYVTNKQNQEHAALHGLSASGERNGSAKLTEEQVREIRVLLAKEMPKQHIADQYGVARSTIGWIARGQTWKSMVYGKGQDS